RMGSLGVGGDCPRVLPVRLSSRACGIAGDNVAGSFISLTMVGGGWATVGSAVPAPSTADHGGLARARAVNSDWRAEEGGGLVGQERDTGKPVAGWLVENRTDMEVAARPFADALHSTQDVVQKAALVALARHREAATVTRPRAWLRRMTRNIGLQIVRKRSRRAELRDARWRQSPELFKLFGDNDVEVWLRGSSQVEPRELVLDAARQLPKALRELVELTLIDGLTDEEIAEHCGIAVTTVRGRRLRAIRAIREAISPGPRGR
ncbi:MAG: RNA polymerase sigma factor, partial [Gemmatimonadetes bacterium]|nr:RNA polymerase sigma factor [Gemmatimonadota bacterium]